MARRQATRGVCTFCGSSVAKVSMTRHLQQCQARAAASEAVAARGKKRPVTLFHIAVQGKYDPHYWLHVELPANARLYELDQFLRDIWLECCGHMSSFTVNGRTFMSTIVDGYFDEDEDMDITVGKVLSPAAQLEYEYDFGSTTELALRVVGTREAVAPSKGRVHLLARNEPPEITCEVCAKPAAQICTYCGYPALCEACAEGHECGDEGFLPVVNSPRMGVCGYTGLD